MDYAVHNVPSYQHLMGSHTPAHMGSKNSEGHLAGGDAGYSTPAISGSSNSYGAKEHDPGGATPSRIGSGGKHNMGT
jgi:hypothetical protein